MRMTPSRSRIRAARLVALAVDALQIVVFPVFGPGALSPFEDGLDVATALVMTWLVGWHWSFLPSFLAELVPGLDLVPTWTVSVWMATRHVAPAPPPSAPPSPPSPPALPD